MNETLLEAFNTILQPSHQEGKTELYVVVEVVGLSCFFVGKDMDGCACLLMKCSDNSEQNRPSIRLENLEVQFNIPCHVKKGNEPTGQNIYTVIRCRSHEQEVTRYFFSVCETIVELVGDYPKQSELSSAIAHLTAIFQKLQKPPSRSVNGLFGELFFIRHGRNPIRIMEAWRNEDEARYDFSDSDIRIDVKTSSVRQRIHSFSFEQCNPPPESYGVVASLFIERSPNGMSLKEIMAEIESIVSNHPQLIFKLRDVVAGTLGSSIKEALSISFDFRLAASSLSFYKLSDVPAIREPIPYGVSGIHFRSDLTELQPLSKNDLIDSNCYFWDFLSKLD